VESLASIEDEVATLLTLAFDLNDLSMLESGRLHFDAAPFSLRGLVSSVRQIAGSTSTSRDMKVAHDVSTSVPDSVIGDPGRLRLVIVRFIDNVMARSSSGHILLRIDLEERAPESVTLRFAIAATGHNPGPGEAPTNGDDFSRSADDPPASPGHGVLGLPVALETVARMGGHVFVEGEPEQPTSIQFTIRLGIGDDETMPHPAVADRTVLQRPILIVADTLDDRRSIVKTLSKAELPYVVTSSADEWATAREANDEKTAMPALAVIASTRDSFAACDRFRELAESVPIIVIASSGQRGDAARCRERGVRGYLANPMDPGDLVDAIRSAMALVESGDTTTLVTRHWLRDGRRSLHVLVVDDSTTSLFLMTRMLEQRGHSTETACDGAEAVEAFRGDPFDVILMDIMMPGVDGLEATRLIRSMEDESVQRPLIVGVSPFTDQASRDRCYNAGMDALLTKPIRPDDLFALVEQQTVVEPTRTA
jgi:CheY-like chemotaxis protein